MNINKLLEKCNINTPYNIFTTNDFIISHAPYINSCEDLETLYGTHTSDKLVSDLREQNTKFLHENFEISKSEQNNYQYNCKNKDDDNYKIIDDVLDNFLLGIIVIFAIIMFINVMPKNY